MLGKNDIEIQRRNMLYLFWITSSKYIYVLSTFLLELPTSSYLVWFKKVGYINIEEILL